MGRRIKEPADVHRAHIAAAAGRLFLERGIEATKMDDIAKEAGYSKATLYVYFQNKEEIVGVLALESMKKLYDFLRAALDDHAGTRPRYDGVCHALLRYQETYPFYFDAALEAIRFGPDCLPVEQETFLVGEQINHLLAGFLRSGMEVGDIRPVPVLPTVFAFWGMLSGLLRMAENKRAYIEEVLGLSKDSFLALGFDTLYHSISSEVKS